MKNFKRVISLIIAILMTITSMPIAALADRTYSGPLGAAPTTPQLILGVILNDTDFMQATSGSTPSYNSTGGGFEASSINAMLNNVQLPTCGNKVGGSGWSQWDGTKGDELQIETKTLCYVYTVYGIVISGTVYAVPKDDIYKFYSIDYVYGPNQQASSTEYVQKNKAIANKPNADIYTNIGYRFTGWKWSTSDGQEPTGGITQHYTATAQYEMIPYDVTFTYRNNNFDWDTSPTKTVTYGEKVSSTIYSDYEADPEKDGVKYLFQNWTVNGETKDPAKEAITEDTEFVASYQDPHTVQFYYKDATSGTGANSWVKSPAETVTHGEKIKNGIDPAYEADFTYQGRDIAFLYWTDEAGNKVDPSTAVITEDTVFYAKYDIPWVITFIDKDGQETPVMVSDGDDVPDQYLDGWTVDQYYAFKAWHTGSATGPVASSSVFTNIHADATYYGAYYDPIEITFITGLDHDKEPIKVKAPYGGTVITPEGNDGNAKCIGWATSPTATTALPASTFRSVTKEQTYYALYAGVIRINYYDGTELLETYTFDPAEKEQPMELKALTDKTGYVTLGWSLTKNGAGTLSYGAGLNSVTYREFRVASDMNFYATYREPGAVFYDEKVQGHFSTYKNGNIIAPADSDMTYTRARYIFEGWIEGNRCKIIGPDDTLPANMVSTFTVEDDGKEYAMVLRERIYTITYKDGDTVIGTRDVKYGADATQPENLAYDGFIYEIGKTKDGTGTFVGWEPVIFEVTENATLIAKFDPNISLDPGSHLFTYLNPNGTFHSSEVIPAGEKAHKPLTDEAVIELARKQGVIGATAKVNFDGWEVLEGTQHGEIWDFEGYTVEENYTLQPKFKSTYMVQFVLDGEVIDSEQISIGSKAVKPEKDPTKDGKRFAYWAEGSVTGSRYNFDSVPTSNIELHAVFSDVNYVFFENTGNTVDPHEYIHLDDNKLETLPDETKAKMDGYTLAGWSYSKHDPFKSTTEAAAIDDPADLAAINRKLQGGNNVTLYAVWVRARVEVQVIYWEEKSGPERGLDPNTGFYPESVAKAKNVKHIYDPEYFNTYKTATAYAYTGDELKYNNGKIDNLYSAKTGDTLYSCISPSNSTYYGLTNSDTVTVTGTGTVINIYFTRNLLEAKFKWNTSYTMTFNGQEYKSEGDSGHTGLDTYVLKAELDENIESRWPYAGSGVVFKDASGKTQNFYGWGSFVSKRVTFTNDLKTTHTAKFSKTDTYYLIYMFESTKDQVKSGSYLTYNGVNYTANPEYCQFIGSTSGFSCKTISGMKDVGATSATTKQPTMYPSWSWPAVPDGMDSTVHYQFLYYKRNEYKLKVDLNDKGLIDNETVKASYTGAMSQSVKYGEALSHYEPTTEPTRTDCKFMGWYMEPSCETPVDFAKVTMPSQDMTIYAKWIVKPVTITYYYDEKEREIYARETNVPAGSADPGESEEGKQIGELTNNSNYGEFEGWYYYPYANSVMQAPFEPGQTVVTKDTKVFAKWKNQGYKLKYICDDDANNIFMDDKGYALNEGAVIRSLPSYAKKTYEKDGKTKNYFFIGWREVGGNSAHLMQPGDFYNVYYDAAFTALWRDEDSIATITYHKNPTEKDVADETEKINWLKDSKQIKAAANNWWQLKGYKFLGWSKDKNATTASIQPGTNLSTDQDMASFDLYAIWEPDPNTPYKVEHYKKGSNGKYPTNATETEKKTGTTGTFVNTAEAPLTKTYEGYTLDTDDGDGDGMKSDGPKQIKGDGSTVVKLYYNRNTYTLDIKYVYEDDTADDYTDNVPVEGGKHDIHKVLRYGENYIHLSPEITDANPDLTEVKGTITEDTIVYVVYTKDPAAYVYVTYVTPAGISTPKAIKEQKKAGASYTYVSPDLTGCELKDPTQKIIQGEMDDKDPKDVRYTVEYVLKQYDLVIDYVYGEGEKDATKKVRSGETITLSYTDTLPYKESFSIDSPVIPGYTADIETVTGTIKVQADPNKIVENHYVVKYYENEAITIYFESEDPAKGEVTLSSQEIQLEKVKPVSEDPDEVTAVANDGYHFTKWTLKEDSTYKFEKETLTAAKGDDKGSTIWTERTYVANFEEDEDVEITFKVDPAAAAGIKDGNTTVAEKTISISPVTGLVSGTTDVYIGDVVYVQTDDQSYAYEFVEWRVQVGTGNPVKLSEAKDLSPVKGDDDGSTVWTKRTYIAVFEKIAEVTLTFKTDGHGSVQIDGSSEAAEDTQGPMNRDPAVSGTTVKTVVAVASNGYTFDYWDLQGDATFKKETIGFTPAVGDLFIPKPGMEAEDPEDPSSWGKASEYWTNRTYVAHFTEREDMPYTVEHYKSENTDVPVATDHLTGTYGQQTNAVVKSTGAGETFEGYVPRAFDQKTIEVDTVVRIYYDRDTFEYSVEYYYGDNATVASATETYSALYGDVIGDDDTEYADFIAKNTYDNVEYAFTRIDPEEGTGLTVGIDATANIIKVYFHDLKASLNVVKTADKVQSVALGETITYTVNVGNTGDVEIQNVKVTDDLSGVALKPGTSPITSIEPGDSKELTFTYVVTEADIAAGSIVNVARANGSATKGVADPTEASDTVIVTTETKSVALEVIKESNVTKSVTLGDTITYTVNVKNTGNQTVTDIKVKDNLTGAVLVTGDNATITSLAPGKTSDAIHYTYVVTEADILAGEVRNTATASDGKCGTEDVPSATSNEVIDKTVDVSAELTVVKTTDKVTTVVLGETITYTITVENTGNQTVNNVVVTDTLLDLSDKARTDANVTFNGTPEVPQMEPGASTTFTATYVVTEEDLLNGKIINQAFAKGSYGPNLSTDEFESNKVENVTDKLSPELTVTKASNKVATVTLGETITYTITVENTGNLTVRNVVVSDTLLDTSDQVRDGVNVTFSGTPEVAQMAPGESTTFTATYVVTEEDLLNGKVINQASAKGSYANDRSTEDFLSGKVTDQTEEANGELSIVKTADPNGTVGLGATITYSITVTNIGNQTVNNINIADTLLDPSNQARGDASVTFNVDPVINKLAPGESSTFEATYTVTETDILNGKVVNKASAKGSYALTKSTDEVSDDVENLTEEINNNLVVTKAIVATTAKSSYALGDTITYEINVANEGNVTLNTVTVTDALTTDNGHGTTRTNASVTFDGANVVDVLVPGTSATFTATYNVVEDDILNGGVFNTATATAVNPKNSVVYGNTAVADAKTQTPNPKLEIVKESDPQGTIDLGSIIKYTVTVKNVGNVTVSDIEVKDALFGSAEAGTLLLNGGSTTANNNIVTVTSLGPVNSGSNIATITYDYKVTEADIIAKTIVNTATANGTNTSKEDTEPGEGSTTNTPVDPAPHMTLTKEIVSTAADGKSYQLDEEITYKITVKNDGNVTLSNVKVIDELTNGSDELAADPAVIAPGAEATVTVTYKVTEDDIKEGTIVNIATAKGSAPYGVNEDPGVEDGHNETSDIAALNPHLTTRKESSLPTGKTTLALHDVITYTITVTNDGNQTIEKIKVEDDHLALADAGSMTVTLNGATVTDIPTTMVPEDVLVISYTYTVKESDITSADSKVVNNVAVSGENKSGDKVPTDDASDKTDDPVAPAKAHLTLTKTIASTPADGESYQLGEKIIFRIDVLNDGNVTVSDIKVTDKKTGNVEGNELIPEPATLIPGATGTVTVEYAVTEKDILNGTVQNSATATGKAPEGVKDPTVEDGKTKTDDITKPAPHVTVSKEIISTPADGKNYQLGEKITYKVTVKNDGNMTLEKVKITDELTNKDERLPVKPDTIEPGAEGSVEVTYTVTEKDILAGSITNSATASGVTPDGAGGLKVEDGTVKTEDISEPTPHMTVSKEITSTPADGSSYQLGEEITYKVTVKNVGNMTLTGVKITDEMTGDVNRAVKPADLKPGEEGSVEVRYTVTEEDILAGSITNNATAGGTAPEGAGDPDVDDGEAKTEDVADPKPELNVEVTSDKDGKKVEEGDEIEYTVTITNDGNVTISDIELADSLGVLPDDLKDIGELAPGETRTITYKYTVEPEDLYNGEVKNMITAEGEDPTGEDVKGEGNNTVTTEEPEPAVTVKGKTDQGEKNPVPGTVITYTVVITNDGNATLYDLVLDDPLVVLPADKREIGTLAPGESKTITYEYVVTQDDANYGSVTFKPTVTGKDASGEKVSGKDETKQTVVNNKPAPVYAVTVNYWYESIGGKMAAPQFLNYYKEGAQYTVISRQLSGYTVDKDVITGTMGTKDLVFDVIYKGEKHTVTLRLVDENGNVIGEDLVFEYTVGEQYSIDVPAIDGYEPIISRYTGTVKGQNEVLTAFYMAVGGGEDDPDAPGYEERTVIDDYATPLAGSNTACSVGECIE